MILNGEQTPKSVASIMKDSLKFQPKRKLQILLVDLISLAELVLYMYLCTINKNVPQLIFSDHFHSGFDCVLKVLSAALFFQPIR